MTLRPSQYQEIGEDRHLFDADGYLDKPAPDPAAMDMRVWRSPGPTITAFMQSMAAVQGVMGPVGGGKTISVFYKNLMIATRQPASPIDGIRRYKLATVRETYRQLNKTTIPSWHKYFPKTAGKWQGGGGEPATHLINFNLPDGTTIEFIHEFIAIGEHSVEDALRGYEPTAFFLNEYDRLPPEVLAFARGRAGRYPDMAHGGPAWYGVICDFNAPNHENHAARDFILEKPEDRAFFRQPSGLAPNAENLANLPPGYYEEQISGSPDWYVRRMVRNELGFSREGEPVYPEYNDDLHVAKERLRPDPKLPLLIGGDAGRQPALILGQRDWFGRWRALEELCGESMGANSLAKVLMRVLNERYLPWLESSDPHAIACWGDPSANNPSDHDDDETWLSIMRAKTKLRWMPAPVLDNSLTVRLEAVREVLGGVVRGEPQFLIDPVKCPMLRMGFNYGYRYKRLRIANAEEYDDKPDKGRFSHPHDALQYLILGGGEYDVLMGRQHRSGGRQTQTGARTEDEPDGSFRRRGHAR